MTGPNDTERRAAMRVAKEKADTMLNLQAFSGRGFSARTIQLLADCSIDAPERILFMSEEQIKNIPGAGSESVAEILAYRAKFIR